VAHVSVPADEFPRTGANHQFAIRFGHCVLLALTAGLAAACFVRVFGITFLALPRTEAGERAQEMRMDDESFHGGRCPWPCLTFGVAPALIISPVNRAIEDFIGTGADISFNWNVSALQKASRHSSGMGSGCPRRSSCHSFG